MKGIVIVARMACLKECREAVAKVTEPSFFSRVCRHNAQSNAVPQRLESINRHSKGRFGAEIEARKLLPEQSCAALQWLIQR